MKIYSKDNITTQEITDNINKYVKDKPIESIFIGDYIYTYGENFQCSVCGKHTKEGYYNIVYKDGIPDYRSYLCLKCREACKYGVNELQTYIKNIPK